MQQMEFVFLLSLVPWAICSIRLCCMLAGVWKERCSSEFDNLIIFHTSFLPRDLLAEVLTHEALLKRCEVPTTTLLLTLHSKWASFNTNSHLCAPVDPAGKNQGRRQSQYNCLKEQFSVNLIHTFWFIPVVAGESTFCFLGLEWQLWG